RAPDWLPNWWPDRERQILSVTNWRTDQHQATIPHAKEIMFSADGNRLAVVRTDTAIDVYEFPFRTPWGKVAAAALLASGTSWSIGWLWARWRRKPQGAAA